ncbi:DUF4403 family protein [Paludibacter sp.]|uniref:DUF4403 family protein n=1 Tax=Paludibacter sp. TaxID=1898105 RepID=UPI001354064B|nr:DUF4403 family protein [Paludibacter sp.]MTK53786.1 DUF4403 family protein [Paludibacter sp.]
MRKYSYLFLSLILFLSACGSSQLLIDKPTENYIPPTIENKTSTIGISLDIDVQDLEKSINSYLKNIIYEDNNLSDDNLRLKVWKQQDIHFTISGNKINCTIPLKIWVETGFKKTILGATIQQYYQATGGITINLSSTYQLQNDWKITTFTKINNFNWTERPTVKVAGIEMPVTMIANLTLKALQQKINKSIDAAISKNMDVRQIMTKTWTVAQKPIQVNKNYDVWLKVTPKSILSTPMVANGSHVNFNLGMNAQIETSVGSQIKNNDVNNLPDYQYVSAIKPEFNLLLNVNLDYKELTDIASKQIVGRTFNQRSKHITIDKVKFYGHNDLLVVETHVMGSANGTVYCVGKLAFDNVNQTLSVTNFDFDMKTKNVLVKSANWLMHNRFLKMIEPYLTISMKDQINDIVKTSNEMLTNYELIKGINLSGKLVKSNFDAITITPNAIVVSGQLSGNLKLKVNQLQF